MAEIVKRTSSDPSMCSANPPQSKQTVGVAGQALGACDQVYLASDGTYKKASGAGVAPPAAPAVATATTGGTVAAGTYQVGVTYVKADGTESTLSEIVPITTTGATSTITVTSPAASTGATKYRVYFTTVNGQTLRVQNTTGTNLGTDFTLTAPPATNTAEPPTTNSTPGVGNRVRGQTRFPADSGEAVTVVKGCRFEYSDVVLTKGADVYLSGTVAGGLADTASVGGQSPVGYVLEDGKTIEFFEPR